MKCLGGSSNSPPRRDLWEQDLPWALFSIPLTARLRKAPTHRRRRDFSVAGIVCSRAVNGCSGHGIHDHTIAVKSVATRLATGGAGGRASSIGRPRTASNTDANSRSDIESVCASGKQRQLTRSRRARASALRRSRKIFRDGRALGRVATSFSSFPMNIRTNDFAVWRAGWRYVACWIAKHATRRGVGTGVVSA
jgi:hypothetical protein